MIRRSWNTVLASVALVGGMAATTAVEADEVRAAGGPSDTCEKIFADPKDDLTLQLASMSCCENSCCAPDACCENSCCAPAECCLDNCGDIGCCAEGCCAAAPPSEITVGGWVQMGYHSGVTPAAAAANAGSFNAHPHRLNLHQGWLFAEKVADGSNGLDWGFRADLMYGVDGPDTQSFGNRPGRFDNGGNFTRGAGYGFAIPQLYAELAEGDWSVKVGHFYTLVGYEVVTAPDNFFYSHSLTMFNSEPFTHTGALVTYSATDDLTLYGGWTAGWDTGFDRVSGGSSFLGGFSTPVGDNATFTYINTFGHFGARSVAGAAGGNHSYSHSLLLDVAVNDTLNLVLQSDVVRTGNDDDVGINSYLIKTINDQLAAGIRAEWWKNEGDSQYAITYGVNIKPTDNLVIRPEIRHDWHVTNGANTRASQDVFGIDAILTF